MDEGGDGEWKSCPERERTDGDLLVVHRQRHLGKVGRDRHIWGGFPRWHGAACREGRRALGIAVSRATAAQHEKEKADPGKECQGPGRHGFLNRQRASYCAEV
jgi:hypothetical protein